MSNASTRSIKKSRMETVVRSWVPKPILDPEITQDLPTIDAYVGVLKEKKDISKAIQSISTILPGIDHLKRCSGNKILLAPVRSSNLISEVNSTENNEMLREDRLKIILKEKGFDLTLLEDDLQVIKVPGTSAKTKAQATRASKIWPIKFHPDPFLEAVIDGSIFSEDQLRKIENCMTIAISAAKLEAIGNPDCNGSAVVIDPDDGRVLAIAASRIDRHPMWHASMLAIDLVAKLHGGGAWNLDEEFHQESTFLRENIQKSRDIDGNFEKRMKIIKRKYEEEAPLCYPKALAKITIPVAESLEPEWTLKGRRNNGPKKADTNVELLKTDVTNPVDSNEKCGPYLCTGYWVFLLKEPCPMCAMALLHSRVARIFYGVPNERTGVLGSNGVLHAVPGLNHRYRVWSEVMREMCEQVSKEIEQRNVGN
ncbi:hypothetical protein KPH14_006146 [Odynerus spinipes]|uniref:CMP/dCMP-type deaminase domain-containing protein n=1 Tax=Odynerus spinipes TaxID=1348599 RepID=A0AAD9RII0_9HYME|nr:hypothetical protein KPH14_006146 [Odynerus spinipes]